MTFATPRGLRASTWRRFDGGEGHARAEAGAPCTSLCSGPDVMQATTPRWYRIERSPTGTTFFVDGIASARHLDSNPADYSLMFRNAAASSDLVVDWVRARALASPEPTVTLGAEETPPP